MKVFLSLPPAGAVLWQPMVYINSKAYYPGTYIMLDQPWQATVPSGYADIRIVVYDYNFAAMGTRDFHAFIDNDKTYTYLWTTFQWRELIWDEPVPEPIPEPEPEPEPLEEEWQGLFVQKLYLTALAPVEPEPEPEEEWQGLFVQKLYIFAVAPPTPMPSPTPAPPTPVPEEEPEPEGKFPWGIVAIAGGAALLLATKRGKDKNK